VEILQKEFCLSTGNAALGEKGVRMFAQKRIAYVIILVGAVGGLVIGLVAGTNVSPVLAGILGTLVIFSIFAGISFLTGNEHGDE